MKSFLKYFFVFAWAIIMCTACSSEKVEPGKTTTPKTNTATRIEVTHVEVPEGVISPAPKASNSTKTFYYKAVGLQNTNRTYLTVSGFDEGCSCWSSTGDCNRLIIKDKNGNEIVNTDCMPANRFIKIPGQEFSVTLTIPSWSSWSSDVDIEVMDW